MPGDVAPPESSCPSGHVQFEGIARSALARCLCVALLATMARCARSMPPLWKFIRSVKDALPSLMPCDATGFLNCYADIRHDFAMLILAARIKEPTCVAVLVDCYRRHRSTGACVYTAKDLRTWLQTMISSVNGCPKKYATELEQLSKQGVGRIMGAQTICTVLSLARRQFVGLLCPTRLTTLRPQTGTQSESDPRRACVMPLRVHERYERACATSSLRPGARRDQEGDG